MIAGMSVFHNLSRLEMAADSYIGRWNFFSANPSFSRILPEAGKFSLARGAYVTNRHEIDCSGGVFLGEFSCVAGSGSLIQTHAINFDLDAQTGASVSIGEFSFVGSRCVLLMGASVAPQSVVGAKSLVLKDNAEGVPGLYAGVPVKYIRAIDGKWFSRTSAHTRSIANLASREVFPEAF